MSNSPKCNICGNIIKPNHQCPRRRKCAHCGLAFNTIARFNEHQGKCVLASPPILRKNFKGEFLLVKSAFKNINVDYLMKDCNCQDITWLFGMKGHLISDLLKYMLQKMGAYKVQMNVRMLFKKPEATQATVINDKLNNGELHKYTKATILMDTGDIPTLLREWESELDGAVDQFVQRGSGWQLRRLDRVILQFGKYIARVGGCHAQLPDWIQKKHATINIQTDKYCFVYSVLAGLHPTDDHPERPKQYQEYFTSYDFTGIGEVVSISDIVKFEKNNNISINVYTLDFQLHKKHATMASWCDPGTEPDTELRRCQEWKDLPESVRNIVPLKVNKQEKEKHVDLLLIEDHYTLIRGFNRLLGIQGHSSNKFCKNCLSGFPTQLALANHKTLCYEHEPQRIHFQKDPIKFKDIRKQLKCPIVIYADFEAFIKPTSAAEGEQALGNIHLHEPCSYMWTALDWEGKIIYQDRKTCKDAAEEFLDSLIAHYPLLKKYLDDRIKPAPKVEPGIDYPRSFEGQICHICGKGFTGELDYYQGHEDHDHLTGEFRGITHAKCNMQYQLRRSIPVVFHNLKNYDGHILISAVHKDQFTKVSVIARSLEKYTSITMGKFVFIDSLAFLPASLDNLSQICPIEMKQKYIANITTDPSKQQLLMRKGCIPYEYLDDFDKFEDTSLPPIEAFHSSLSNTNIDQETYNRLQNIWTAFQCKNLGEFCDLYLQLDVYLLCAVFENFRSMSLRELKLDPVHFYSTPGLSWTAALKLTDIELQPILDMDTLLFLEKGIRGGMTCVSKRYAKANNPHCPDFDQSQDHSYLAYLDVNSLYGWALSQDLPYQMNRVQDYSEFHYSKNLKSCLYDEEYSAYHPAGNDLEFILEVDIYYPHKLHRVHRMFPLAPEKMIIKKETLGPEMSYISALCHQKDKSEKLVGTLHHKKNYVVDSRTLRFYLKHGLKITKIHRVMTVWKKPWLKPYIDLCTSKRQEATSKFDKDFWKFLVNSVYGKTMENKRNHSNVHIVMDRQKAAKLLRKPLFTQYKILTEDKVLFNMRKVSVKMDRPMYVGFTVLEYAKMKMYELHYDLFLKRYAQNIDLLYTDTDSLIYQIRTRDLYKDFEEEIFKFHMDFSDYPEDHPLHSLHNKKVYGKLKDEYNGSIITEFIALKAKMYALKSTEGVKKVAKGITRSVVRDEITWENYHKCLFNDQIHRNIVTNIRAKDHIINTVRLQKLSLTPFDDKRYYRNNVDSLPWGHHDIPGHTDPELIQQLEDSPVNWFNMKHQDYSSLKCLRACECSNCIIEIAPCLEFQRYA